MAHEGSFGACTGRLTVGQVKATEPQQKTTKAEGQELFLREGKV